MTSTPKPPQTDENPADDVAERLRKEVASWREGRSDGSSRQATDLSVAVARSIVPPTNAKMKRAAPKAAPAEPATTEKKKPFGMSYGGTSRADYVKSLAARGMK